MYLHQLSCSIAETPTNSRLPADRPAWWCNCQSLTSHPHLSLSTTSMPDHPGWGLQCERWPRRDGMSNSNLARDVVCRTWIWIIVAGISFCFSFNAYSKSTNKSTLPAEINNFFGPMKNIFPPPMLYHKASKPTPLYKLGIMKSDTQYSGIDAVNQ